MQDLIIFLVLGAIALVFRWLSNQASDISDEIPEPPKKRPETGAPTEPDAERIRRFLEALGQPPGTTPPPPVRPRSRPTTVPAPSVPRTPTQPVSRRRSWVAPLPPVTTVPPPEPIVVVEMDTPPPPAPPPPNLVVAVPPAVPVLQVRPAGQPAPVTVTAAPGLLVSEWLRNPQSVRQAIVLREILGTARGLQPLGEISHEAFC